LWLAGLALLAVAGASGLALSALKDQAAFYYAPSDLKAKGLPLGKAVRLGGLVERGSLHKAADGITLTFTVVDRSATVPVTFKGIAPDLFRENSGVVAEGRFQPDGSFVASNLLAKHDEKYQPPEMAGTLPQPKPPAR
jgi:cytochrome c-type biogenesis protein CcmE